MRGLKTPPIDILREAFQLSFCHCEPSEESHRDCLGRFTPRSNSEMSLRAREPKPRAKRRGSNLTRSVIPNNVRNLNRIASADFVSLAMTPLSMKAQA